MSPACDLAPHLLVVGCRPPLSPALQLQRSICIYQSTRELDLQKTFLSVVAVDIRSTELQLSESPII